MNDAAAGAEARTFAALAQRYRDLIDARNTHTTEALMGQCSQLLASLYAAAVALPEVDGSDEPPESGITNADWHNLYASLQTALGPSDYYREVFDPYDLEEGEPVVGSLADDLADIYRDLSEGLALWNAGNQEDAIWAWSFGFQAHWGEHATSALRAIYSFLHR